MVATKPEIEMDAAVTADPKMAARWAFVTVGFLWIEMLLKVVVCDTDAARVEISWAVDACPWHLSTR